MAGSESTELLKIKPAISDFFNHRKEFSFSKAEFKPLAAIGLNEAQGKPGTDKIGSGKIQWIKK
ncbi:MAG: hypothetical protein P1V20_04435 [Verrucomicrobiales bacterium]|nr:hypothetical protein [Verrucomicrobiales bacterium]